MNRLIKYNIFVSFLIVINSCIDSTGTKNAYTVSGIISYNGIAKQGVSVSIDDAMIWKTETDESGYFVIESVSEGSHIINAKVTEDDSRFSERSSTIEIYDDTHLSELILPRPVQMQQPIGLSPNSISLSWTTSNAFDFREYKLFRHITSGLDEYTGVLVHISTSIMDTIFIDNTVDPSSQYYYRIYVMNEYGKLGGSNIASITTENMDVIMNGGFEEINGLGLPHYWSVWNSATFIQTDSSVSHNGNYSIRFDVNNLTPNHTPLYQNINPSAFQPGARYQLSYWVKASEMTSNQNGYYVIINSENNSDWSLFINPITGPKDAMEWTLSTYDFTYPENNTASNIILAFYCETSPDFTIWVDQVSLLKIQ